MGLTKEFDEIYDDFKGSFPRSIAIVSGKGGSGKTMLAATLMTIIDRAGKGVLLVDADTGTGGLSYYMGLKHVSNISYGMYDLALGNSKILYNGRALQRIENTENSVFLPSGNIRKLNRLRKNNDKPKNSDDHYDIVRAIETLMVYRDEKSNERIMIFDCRGGIDNESLAICAYVDAILLVVESDTTSFQASQLLVDSLEDRGLSDKLVGFIINKAIEDPSVIARNGSSVFRTQYLYSIPFDIATTKEFLVGNIPKRNSLFELHTRFSISKILPPGFIKTNSRVLTEKQFSSLTLNDPSSRIGGVIITGALIYGAFGAVYLLRAFSDYIPMFNYGVPTDIFTVVSLTILGILGSMTLTRTFIGDILLKFRNKRVNKR